MDFHPSFVKRPAPKKTGRQSARFRSGGFSIKGKDVYLAKIGNFKPIWSRELPEASSVTVIKDAANRYFLSFVVEVESVQIDAENQIIGIDLGINNFAVMSDGSKALSPNYSKIDRKIRSSSEKISTSRKGLAVETKPESRLQNCTIKLLILALVSCTSFLPKSLGKTKLSYWKI